MINVGVFFGSRSVEHEISIITAQQAISQLLADEAYKVIPVYMDKKGDWYTGDHLLNIESFKNMETAISKATHVSMIRDQNEAWLISNKSKLFGSNKLVKIDVAFPILHGSYGEDGTLQGFFEHMQIPYVGCRTMAAAVTMDKIMTKLVLKSSGINVIDDVWFVGDDWIKGEQALIDKIEGNLGYPVIVKPADIGSSVGVTPAKDRDALISAINFVRKFSDRILIEKMVTALQEINISVLGDATEFELSVCEEPISDSEFLTFEDKYASGGSSSKSKTPSPNSPNSLPGMGEGVKSGASGGMSSARREIPAKLDPALQQTIEDYARVAFKALDCSGVSRIDFIIDKSTQTVYLNEFNTIPGSLSFYLWEATGVPFAELLNRLIRLSIKKYDKSQSRTLSNNTNILQGISLGGVKK